MCSHVGWPTSTIHRIRGRKNVLVCTVAQHACREKEKWGRNPTIYKSADEHEHETQGEKKKTSTKNTHKSQNTKVRHLSCGHPTGVLVIPVSRGLETKSPKKTVYASAGSCH
ncbi:hypothetical protein Dimus_006271 [Dionaea muscipula]